MTEILAICFGASLGALSRWGLSEALNRYFPMIPLGTLLANLLGGYLIGLAIAFFSHQEALNPALRLFVITGFLGALTTFSTFSAEITALLEQGRLGWAAIAITTHLGGSLIMTSLGLMTFRLFKFAL